MAVYKVIQDIEAEDKLFGPLTLKQFIFACITVAMGYFSFWSIANGVPWLLIVFLPPFAFFGTLTVPWSKEQSTEVWLMAKIRFYFRPKRRIWDQTGLKELVKITVPKKDEIHYTDGLSNVEVKSRLRALADTIDSRGWAVKNSNVNLAPAMASNTGYAQYSDRLVAPQDQPAPDPIMAEVRADYDMYDESSNATAQKFDQIIQQSESQHRDAILEKIESARSHVGDSGTPTTSAPPPTQATQSNQQSTQNDYWFMREPTTAPNSSQQAVFGASPLVTPGQQQSSGKQGDLTAEEKATLQKIREQKQRPDPMNSHLKTIKPLSEQDQDKPRKTTKTKQQTHKPKPKETAPDTSKDNAKAARMNLARDNNLSVETIAKEANKGSGEDGEVVISLH